MGITIEEKIRSEAPPGTYLPLPGGGLILRFRARDPRPKEVPPGEQLVLVEGNTVKLIDRLTAPHAL